MKPESNTPIEPCRDTAIPNAVFSKFGIQQVSSVSRLGGTRNINLCVRCPDQSFFLRQRHPDYCDSAWIQFDHNAATFLRKHGASVQEPISTIDGKTWFYYRGKTWEAYPWVEGNPWPGTRKALESVARNLATFHSAGIAFNESFCPGGYPRGEMTPHRLLALAKALAPSCGHITKFYTSQVVEASKRLDDETYNSLPHTLVHGDIQPSNMIFSGSELSSFIDYDWLGRQPPIYDLAGAIIFFCGNREKPIDGGDIWSLSMPFTFDGGMITRFLQVYREHRCFPDDVLLPLLMEQVRLTWVHIRLSGAHKVKPPEREAFLSRDFKYPFAWIDDHFPDM